MDEQLRRAMRGSDIERLVIESQRSGDIDVYQLITQSNGEIIPFLASNEKNQVYKPTTDACKALALNWLFDAISVAEEETLPVAEIQEIAFVTMLLEMDSKNVKKNGLANLFNNYPPLEQMWQYGIIRGLLAKEDDCAKDIPVPPGFSVKSSFCTFYAKKRNILEGQQYGDDFFKELVKLISAESHHDAETYLPRLEHSSSKADALANLLVYATCRGDQEKIKEYTTGLKQLKEIYGVRRTIDLAKLTGEVMARPDKFLNEGRVSKKTILFSSIDQGMEDTGLNLFATLSNKEKSECAPILASYFLMAGNINQVEEILQKHPSVSLYCLLSSTLFDKKEEYLLYQSNLPFRL